MKRVYTIQEDAPVNVRIAMYAQRVNNYMSWSGESLEKSIRYELGGVTSPVSDEDFEFDLNKYKKGSEFLQKYNLEYRPGLHRDYVPTIKNGKDAHVVPVKK